MAPSPVTQAKVWFTAVPTPSALHLPSSEVNQETIMGTIFVFCQCNTVRNRVESHAHAIAGLFAALVVGILAFSRWARGTAGAHVLLATQLDRARSSLTVNMF